MTSRSKKEKELVELIPHLTENSSNLLTDTKPQDNNLTKTSPPRKPLPLIDSSSQDTQIKNSPKSRRSISTKKSFKEDSLIKQSTLQRKGTTLSKNPSPYIKEDIESNYSDDTIEGEGFYVDPFEKINRKLFRREKICDTDTEDSASEDEGKIKWVILPETTFKRVWDTVITIVILYSSLVTPYKLAFSANNGYDPDDYITDILLGIDIVINFFSAYTDREENLVKNRKKIALKYLKTWFIPDLVSVFPFSEVLSNNNNVGKLAKMSRLPKLYKLLKLTKLVRITKMKKSGNLTGLTKFFFDKLKLNANIEKLIYFLLTFVLLAHLSTCIWYFVAKLEDLNPDSWVVRLGYIDSSNYQIYILSFYWTLTTVTTVGYGDVSAGTTPERIYNLFIMSFGVLMYSFAIGSLSSIIAALDQKSAEMNQKLEILTSIKKEYNLNQEIYDKVRKVIKFDLNRNQKDKMQFLMELPNKLRIELSQIMHDKAIQNLNFFKDQPSDFFAYVAHLLKPVKFSQNDYLYKVEDMIDEMYFVIKGTIIFVLEPKYNEREIKDIGKNNNFGEIEMCLNEKLRFSIKVKSRSCELFVLKKNDFLRLSVNFKEFIESFLQKSLMIYLKYNEERKKLIAEEEAMMDKIHKKSKPKAEKNDEKGKVSIENTSEDGKSMMNSLRSHKILKSKKNLISGMNSSRELSIKTEAIKSEDDKKIRKIKSNPNNNQKKKNIDIHPENTISEKESINQ